MHKSHNTSCPGARSIYAEYMLVLQFEPIASIDNEAERWMSWTRRCVEAVFPRVAIIEKEKWGCRTMHLVS